MGQYDSDYFEFPNYTEPGLAVKEELPDLIGKAVVESERSTYKFDAYLFELNEKQRVEFPNISHVYGDDGKLIGYANISSGGGEVWAGFIIDSATPERLNLETKSVKMYAIPNFMAFDGHLSLHSVTLTSIPPKYRAIND